ncbi:MAG: rhodanese-like domain-containing protein [Smithellaceae bacterium]|nr:rhodanese-like domain-containing protein [Smithellaceae bacterium]
MSKKLLVFVAVLSLMLSTVGMSIAQDTKSHPVNNKVKSIVESTKKAVKNVTLADVKKSIDSKEKAIYLDVRDESEFAAGHIPGAKNISRGTLEFKVAKEIPDTNTKIYVYCKTIGRSALATKTLNDLGYKNAILMRAQYADWVKAGYPVER